MSPRARELSSHFNAFNKRLLTFLRGLEEPDLDRVLPIEGYTIRTVAAHISGPRHYGMRVMFRNFLNGDDMPDLTNEEIIANANRDFDEHAGWDTRMVLENLESEGEATFHFIADLSDEELARKAVLKRFEGTVSLEQAIDWILIGGSVEHLENMRRIV